MWIELRGERWGGCGWRGGGGSDQVVAVSLLARLGPVTKNPSALLLCKADNYINESLLEV